MGVATGVRVGGSHGFCAPRGLLVGYCGGYDLVDRGWVASVACLALLSSFSAQDSSVEEGGAPWSRSDGVRP